MLEFLKRCLDGLLRRYIINPDEQRRVYAHVAPIITGFVKRYLPRYGGDMEIRVSSHTRPNGVTGYIYIEFTQDPRDPEFDEWCKTLGKEEGFEVFMENVRRPFPFGYRLRIHVQDGPVIYPSPVHPMDNQKKVSKNA